ncbi:MAG: sulfatase-like hydrolase/transferase [Rubripirellula sp.]|nr:sulfatase-like hydrolase/transferase [Rubripirellula sp.]
MRSTQNLMIRLRFLIFCCAAAVSLKAFALEPPNLILLMGDDHGWSETGYNGHPFVKTPVLDEMAAMGLRLDRFYAGHPTCSPTRVSVLTGRHPNRSGTFNPGWSIRPEEITIAHRLASVGYRSGHFGKWHVGPVKASSPTNPRAMGFSEYVSHDNFYEMDPQFSRNGGPPEQFHGEGSQVTIDQTLNFIQRSVEAEEPFLAVVWFGSPHEPYSGLPEDLTLYDDLPKDFENRSVRLTSMETGRPTKRPLRDVLRERYAEITAMDRAIGTLREELVELGVRDNTLIWYCGDNGNPKSSGRVATPLKGEKGLMYEGGIRVPGLIEWPNHITMPRTSSVNAVTSDMLPTLCELAGVPTPERPLDGISLAPLLSGRMESRPKPICFWSYPSKRVTQRQPSAKPYLASALQEGTTPLVKYMGAKLTRSFQNFHQPPIEAEDYGGPRVLLDNQYKLVVGGRASGGGGPSNSIELFNLEVDPAEEHNLAETEPQRTKNMQSQLHTWQSSVLQSLRGKDYD